MNCMKLRKSIVAGLFVFASLPLFSLDVYEDELKSAGSTDTIVFINYTGPYARIDSLSSIKGIGSALGVEIAKAPEKSTTAGNVRYSVIHAVDPEETKKLDADIIIIGKDATVDHINNLRHIIASYLSSAYGYSENDAETIAVFITVYNAVYRGNIQQLQSKYKKVVMDNLSPSSCGLSVNYKDWPGASQIVIPLYDAVNGNLSTVDTSIISDREVVKKMQEDDDKNIDARKDMVDIKEREADEAQSRAEAAQKHSIEEEEKLNEEKAKTEEAKKEAEAAQAAADEAQKEAEAAQIAADEAKKEAEENPDDKEAQEKADEAQAAADEAQAAADQAQKEADEAEEAYEEQKQAEDEQQQVVDEAKAEAQKEQNLSDKKNMEAQEERKTIAKDQQVITRNEIANENAPSVYGIALVDETSLLSKIVRVNTNTGEVIKNSPVSYIRNRTLFQVGDTFIAIAGENNNNGTIKLVAISTDTMEIIAESNETVSENSVLIQDEGNYYCVIADNGNFSLAKYDQNLQLKLKSDVNVKSGTPVTIASDYIIVTDSDGVSKLLNKSDLKLKK